MRAILEGRVSRAEGRLGEGGPEEISGVGSRFGGGGQWGPEVFAGLGGA